MPTLDREATAIARIVVPLDGSPQSERALPVAAAVARHAAAAVTLVHVAEEVDSGFALAPDYPRPLVTDARLAGAAEVSAERVDGPVVETLLARSDALAADLVVLTSRGRGGVRRAVLGSVADAIVRGASAPVLLVRHRSELLPAGESGEFPMDELLGETRTPFRRVLVPLDGSRLAEQVVEAALAVAGTGGVHYHLLRVQPGLTTDGLPGAGGPGDRSAADEDGYLSTMAGRLAERGVVASTHAPAHGSPADVIVRVAGEERVDLVAIATRGLRGADRMVFGSVADQVMRKAPCSILVLRPGAGDPAGGDAPLPAA